MNYIPEKQNQHGQLEMLLAQRRLYSKAKSYFALRVSLALGFGILGPILTSAWHCLAPYVGLAAIAYLLVNVFVLQKCESGQKKNAAKIQESFDTYLLELPWNEYVAGRKPDAEIIAKVLDSHTRNDFSGLENWYAVSVSKVDIGIARLLCQRSNVSWDVGLRRTYIAILITSLMAVIGISILVALIANLTVTQLLVGIVIPLLPFIEVALSQIKENRESARQTDELKGNIEIEIEKIMRGGSLETVEVARVFQDEIFRHRSKCPVIFDWLNELLRRSYENQMQFSVNAKVEEYVQRRTVMQ